MGFFRSVDRAHIDGREIDVNCETAGGWVLRLYIDGEHVDLKPVSLMSLRQVLTCNLNGSKLEVQARFHWLRRGEIWAIWQGRYFPFREVE